jgi:hypothetical protein
LGEAGFEVATGGYIGTMEAVSKGASEAGARVIGVTCVEIETWRAVQANPWVTEQVHCATLRDRLQRLIEIWDALVALPGGIGTLSEISMAWSLLQVQAIPARPLILVGGLWLRTFTAFLDNADGYVRPSDAERLTFVQGVDEAAAHLSSKTEGS